MNISNAAFLILMARNDKNYWLAFGEKRAWDNELAYITEALFLVLARKTLRAIPPLSTCLFISLGQVGEGSLNGWHR